MNMLGIIAGGGEAPKRLIRACRELSRPFHVIAIHGQTDEDIGNDNVPVTWLAMGAAGALRDLAVEKGVKDFVLLGRVRRPALSEIKPDAFLMQKLGRLAPHFLAGDDGLLKAIAKEFDAEGFRIVAPQEVFSELLTPAGQLSRATPSESAAKDIEKGIKVARALGSLDVGQAVVIQEGVVLALEGAEHTDALVRRAGSLKKPGPGPILVKMKKPQQDPRFDLPSIGVDTVKEAAAAGFAGIAVEAQASLLIGREEVIRLADEAGLFLVGITDG
jgi:DUF1009 family protein